MHATSDRAGWCRREATKLSSDACIPRRTALPVNTVTGMKSNARARRGGTRGVEGMRTREKSQAIANSVDLTREPPRYFSTRGLMCPFLSLCRAAPAHVAVTRIKSRKGRWGCVGTLCGARQWMEWPALRYKQCRSTCKPRNPSLYA